MSLYFGVDKQGVLRAAARVISGETWTLLAPMPSALPLSTLGGVTAISLDIEVMAIGFGIDGVVCFSISLDGLIWPPLIPLP